MEHTKEPWRWEFNEKHKTVSIVGGVPKFDLTVMDFERWGMGGAVPRFRDTAHDGMNVMHRLCDRKDWFAPYAGREHHARWHANVIHPDARRIVACINACAGLDTEQLEKFGLGTAFGTALFDVTAQRNELQSQLTTERASLFAESQRKQQLEQQVADLVGVLESMPNEVAGCYCTAEAAARAVIQKVMGGE